MKKLYPLIVLLLAAAACNRQEPKVYTLKSSEITMEVTDFGGRVVSLCTKDREGNWENIVASHKDLKDYITPPGERFLGATVGPVANRIGNASFTLDGVTYNTPANDNGVNTLHGGFKGLDNIYWKVESVCDSAITFSFTHPDLEEGFPGNLAAEVTYSLSGADFAVTVVAHTDKTTPVNITHHPFFCLRGEGTDTVEPYVMWIKASNYIPIDSLSIPTGEIAPVEGTPFDFREPHTIGERIGEDNIQLAYAHGYDHNWCLDKETDGVESVCYVYDPVSGRKVEVLTNQNGLQFYSGNFFSGTEKGSNGKDLIFRCALALEAQGWPDAVNNPEFPSQVLEPGQVYTNKTVYRFSAE